MRKRFSYPLSIVLLSGLSLLYYNSFIQAEVSLAERLSGRILLQVESHGEAWYINPLTKSRHYLGRPDDAFALMRSFGLGISEKDIKKIPLADFQASGPDQDQDGLSDALETALGTDIVKSDSDLDGYQDKDELSDGYDPNGEGKLESDPKLLNRLSGFIIIQAEKNGEAWYVSPADQKRYYLGRPADALAVMRHTGLGISNSDLARVETFERLAAKDENPEQITNTAGKKTYSDSEHGYRLSFPDSWTMNKISGKNETVFLRNYKDDVVKEGKAVMTISYIKIPDAISLARFKTANISGGKKTESKEEKIGDYDTLSETFSFSKTSSLQKNVFLKLNDHAIINATLFSAGNHSNHEQVFADMIRSISYQAK